MAATGRQMMGFEYQDYQTCGTADSTRIWTMNYNNGEQWRQNGFKTQFETTTATTTSDVDTLRVAELHPTDWSNLQFSTNVETAPTNEAIRPNFITRDLNIRDAGMRDYTLRGTWTTGGNFITDEYAMRAEAWHSVRHDDKLEKLFERLTDKEKEKLETWQLERYDAKLKSEKLLKMMLSKKEYESLKLKGEMEIQDPRDQDVIFIVKKESHAMIERHVKGKYKDRHCIVPNPVHELPIGDEILQKVLLLKAKPEEFEKIAIVHA